MDLTKWRLKKSFLSRPISEQSFYLALLCQLLMIGVSLLDWARIIPSKSLFAVSGADVFRHHEFYRIFSAVLAHASWDHVLGNAIFFVPFGALISNYFGLAIFPLLTLLVGGIINFIVISFYSVDAAVLGVSGVVYFMVAFWLILYIGIERGLSIRQKVIRSLGLALVEFMPEKFDTNISYLSHAVGFAMGLMVGYLFFIFKRNDFRSAEVWELIEPVESVESIELGASDPEEFRGNSN